MIKKLSRNLTIWVFVFGALGYILAATLGDRSWVSNPEAPDFYQAIILLKGSFLSLLKMMIAPIVFFSLIGGLINIGEASKLKSLGKASILYYFSTTCIAILIGLTAVFFIHPWKNSDVTMEASPKAQITKEIKTAKPHRFIEPGSDSLVVVFKKILDRSLVNPFEALSERNILGIVFNALLIGIAIILVVPTTSPLIEVITSINKVINKVLGWIILTSPLGIFAIVFDFTLKVNSGVLWQLISFAGLVFGATMLHGVVVLPAIATFFAGVNPKTLLSKIMKPLMIAFGTASSSATLPVSMQTVEEDFGVDKGVSGFVLPLGATCNMDGTALFEGIAAVFLADLYGIELSTVSVFAIFFMSMVSSIGAPGMPSGSMSGMQMVLLGAGIPLEAIGILMVIERPLDTFRTAVNVEGDIIGTLVVQKYLNGKNGAVPSRLGE